MSAWKTEGVTRSKPTKHLARPTRRERGGQPATPVPGSAGTPVAAKSTSAAAGAIPAGARSEAAPAALVIADLALQSARSTPSCLPDALRAHCGWVAALPPAALRQFADQANRALRRATPESLPQELQDVLVEWHETARSFGAP